MSTKRLLLTILAASAVMLAVGIGLRFAGSARALPPAQAVAPPRTGVIIPYSGNLSDEGGQPVADGAYDFAFALYAAESGGEPAWTETHEGVTVQGGAFTALLGNATLLPEEALDGDARWLEVSVRGPGEAEYTLLSPRQELSAAALAGEAVLTNGSSCWHTHWGETWTGSGNGLVLQGDSDGYATLYARDISPNGGFGVYGRSDHGTGAGVYGWGNGAVGVGVFGRGTGAAIYGDGDVKQNRTGDGLVKAGVYVNCNNDLLLGTIRDFNNVNSEDIIPSPGLVNGECTLDFGFDISDRFWVATADMGGLAQGAYGATCMLGNSNDQLVCFRYLASTGVGNDGNIMVLVY